MTEISEALTGYLRKQGLEIPQLGDDPLRTIARSFLQYLIDQEATSVIGAQPYERSEERVTQRNGRRPIESLQTRVGDLELTVPKLRKGSFYPSFLDPRRPVERALVATIQSAYVHGVSTRKVDDLVQALGLSGIDKSAVSRLCKELDHLVKPFRERALSGEYAYVFLDAVYLKARNNGPVVNRALVIAIGVHENGKRDVLGFDVGGSEEEAFWTQFLRQLVKRGLQGVKLVISDAHEGLKAAIGKVLTGAAWQRCRVHFMRNLLAKIPHADKAVVAAFVRTIFAQNDIEQARKTLREVAHSMRSRWLQAADLLVSAEDEVLAYMYFPKEHWTRIYSTNNLERVNREIRRRSDVVQVFPDDASILRLIGAILMEISDEWAIDDRPFISLNSMRKLIKPEMAALQPAPKLAPVR
jgi:transposase-like protein